ncbi:integral membrane protein [Mycobacterium bohemicum DSM 44277]|uniref:DUF6542 domain-containing protein n=2 Tax=Mycobacterium bohemicum TaxID=56425 RepID=A0A1X1R744_MYCBE|nr:hypothetical protein AWB93_09270 [Mycobacterium bohemicum]CPR09125.1 integral membrane protein [Mycobacterium bohemicum DSM 44277]
MEASHRSIHPNIPGVPWWAALLIAVGATAIGFAIDSGSGHKELTHVFAGLYVAGCVAAVLAVRQDGVFTAVIQPPLILFCAVPGGYWLFHGRKVGHLKDVLINCGYPLIERFPLMLGTAGAVLLIGLIRWYIGTSNRAIAAAPAQESGDTDGTGAMSFLGSFLGGTIAKLLSAVRGESSELDEEEPASKSRRTRPSRRPSDARRTTRSDRSATRSTRTQSRRTRPSEDAQEPGAERPRRRQGAPRDVDPADPRRSRRPRPPADPDRTQSRREPRARLDPYERPAPRTSRFDDFDPYQPAGTPERSTRHDRYAPYEPQRRRPRGANGADPTHHPISRVRYRDGSPSDEPRAERPSRSRTPGPSRGRPPAESWD